MIGTCEQNDDSDMDGKPDYLHAGDTPVGFLTFFLVTGRNLSGEGPLGQSQGLVFIPLQDQIQVVAPPRLNDGPCP